MSAVEFGGSGKSVWNLEVISKKFKGRAYMMKAIDLKLDFPPTADEIVEKMKFFILRRSGFIKMRANFLN